MVAGFAGCIAHVLLFPPWAYATWGPYGGREEVLDGGGAEDDRDVAGRGFRFVIALLWNTVVTSGLKVAGVDTTAPANIAAWLYYAVVAFVLTIVMVVFIIVVGRWGAK